MPYSWRFILCYLVWYSRLGFAPTITVFVDNSNKWTTLMKVKKHYRKSGYFDRKFRPAPNFNRIRSKITAVKNIIFDHFLIEYKTGRTSSDEYYPPVFSRSWTRSKIKSRPKYLCGGKFPAIRNLEFFTGSGRKYMFVSGRKYIYLTRKLIIVKAIMI